MAIYSQSSKYKLCADHQIDMAAYTKNESKHKKYHLDPRDLEITVPHGGGILCKILPNEPRTVVHPPTNLGGQFCKQYKYRMT